MSTETPATERNLYQRIADVQADLPPIEKGGRVNFGNTNYSYVSADALFALLQKRLATAGIVVIPMMDSVTASPGGDKNLLATMRFRVVNADDPTDCFEAPWCAQAPGNDDKGSSKAGTSGEKYFLMRLFLMSDEDDPDAETQEMRDAKAAAAPRRPPAPTQAQAVTPIGTTTREQRIAAWRSKVAPALEKFAATGAVPTHEQAPAMRTLIARAQALAPGVDKSNPDDLPPDQLVGVLQIFSMALAGTQNGAHP